MNTEQSDLFAMEWKSKIHFRERVTLTAERIFKAPPEKLFPLLCPATEYDWLPGWDCELLHSKSGYAEYNAIFRTSYFGFEETWVCTHFEPHKYMAYCRYSRNMCTVMDCTLVDNLDSTTACNWCVILSALNGDGNRVIEALQAKAQGMQRVMDAIAHYVDTGRMLA